MTYYDPFAYATPVSKQPLPVAWMLGLASEGGDQRARRLLEEHTVPVTCGTCEIVFNQPEAVWSRDIPNVPYCSVECRSEAEMEAENGRIRK